MSSEIEIEFKNMVTREEFTQLLKNFSINSEDFSSQINHYFDTPDFQLKNHHAALRIREKNSQYTLTLKQPANEGLLETNEKLDTKTAADLLESGVLPAGEVKTAIEQMGISLKDLACFGSLSTKRAEIIYQNGLLVFDHSSYFQKEDYEIEYEVTNFAEGKKIFDLLMQNANIPIRKTDNKVVRFYKEKLLSQNN
ncbi:CYTH domain-containing protein [Heyndrickxia acidicola]|uniref:CYTH domain-containing protein n=1 Tax=Heyndrickxia acidicola TaxID=209389 RepID=A0ABU6MDZ7_9BACI|nr:CYTH domain-containing protein [Heyndrickxia acidicola]MED1202529.1 CYTH domain-containing protein [Heyndrickxia acidicola]